MARNNQNDKKRMRELNSLWNEVLQHNNQLQNDLKETNDELTSWQKIAKDHINENRLLKQLSIQINNIKNRNKFIVHFLCVFIDKFHHSKELDLQKLST